MKKQNSHLQQGFTILELIVVVAVIGLITSLTTDYMMNEGNQQRYKATQDRMKQIQYALIGDSSRTINNQPAFSGYIADTGIMPKYLRDLVSNGYCTDIAQLDKASCEATQNEWREAENWKGPYLQATGYQDIALADDKLITIPNFRDGWGNRNAENDHLNFGWQFDTQFENRAIKVASYGLNGEGIDDDAQSSEYLYEKDAMNLIHHSQLSGSKLDLVINNQTASADSMYCLQANYVDGSQKVVDLKDSKSIPAATVFGKVHVTGLKKQSVNQQCDNAKHYAGIKSRDFYSHNLFSASSKVEIAIN